MDVQNATRRRSACRRAIGRYGASLFGCVGWLLLRVRSLGFSQSADVMNSQLHFNA